MTEKAKAKRIEQLRDRKSKLESKLYEVQLREHEKIRSLGWGYGMRAYKKGATINITQSDKIQEKIKVIDEEIKSLTV